MDIKKMGVNKNISILMLFDCVRVCTSLGFHWICNREKKGVYVNWWWYQSWTIFLYYACWSFLIGENISIWMLPFRFESSCARDGGIWWIILHRGGHIWLFFRRGAGILFLPWVILRRERHHDHIWIFENSNFLWRQFRGGVMPLYGKWVCLWRYMVPSFPPWVFGLTKMSPSLLLTIVLKHKFC